MALRTRNARKLLASHPGLPVLLSFQSSKRSCPSPLRKSGWSFSPQCASHSERGKSARALKEPERTCGPPSSTSKTHYEKALVNRTRATLCFRCQSVQCTPGTSYQLFTGLWSPSTSHCLMLVRDPISRFISDLPLTVTCYRSQ